MGCRVQPQRRDPQIFCDMLVHDGHAEVCWKIETSLRVRPPRRSTSDRNQPSDEFDGLRLGDYFEDFIHAHGADERIEPGRQVLEALAGNQTAAQRTDDGGGFGNGCHHASPFRAAGAW